MNVVAFSKSGKIKAVSSPCSRFIEKVKIGTSIAKYISSDPESMVFVSGEFEEKIYATTLGAALLGCATSYELLFSDPSSPHNSKEYYKSRYASNFVWLDDYVPKGCDALIPGHMRRDERVRWVDILLMLDSIITKGMGWYEYSNSGFKVKNKNKRLEVAKILVWLYEGATGGQK